METLQIGDNLYQYSVCSISRFVKQKDVLGNEYWMIITFTSSRENEEEFNSLKILIDAIQELRNKK